jgi:salicylate hydroxylase
VNIDATAGLLVVGGGVGGLAAALALAQAGGDVHVLEAHREFGEIGAGIQLAPNATRALDALGVLDGLRTRAVFPQELVYMDALTGQRITSVDLGEPFVEHYGHPYMVCHRTELHSALLEACRSHPAITLTTSKHVEQVEERDDNTVTVRCADGTSYPADALVGADGLHSTVRRLIHDDEPIADEHVAYRGTIPFSKVTPHAGVDSMVMWVAPDLHMVQYKLRGGELYNQVAVFRSHRYGMTDDWGSPEELDEHFGRCCAEVSYGASLLGRSARWRMFDRRPIPNWTRNRITLLGDAAHPMVQYIAQGGCQALEDAVCLGRHVAANPDLHEAFLAYQEERIPHTARVQQAAVRFGEVSHLRGIGVELRNALFAAKHPQDYGPLDWVYQARSADRAPSRAMP